MKFSTAFFVSVAISTAFLGTQVQNKQRGIKRSATLKANVKDFQIVLEYNGGSDKPYYNLLLSVPQLNLTNSSPFALQVVISDRQALKIIGYLAATGSLNEARETKDLVKLPRPTYLLGVQGGPIEVTEILGWDLAMLKRLDGLADVLEGDAARSMETLLGRLAGLRRTWQATLHNDSKPNHIPTVE